MTTTKELIAKFRACKRTLSDKERRDAAAYLNYILSGRGDMADVHDLELILNKR